MGGERAGCQRDGLIGRNMMLEGRKLMGRRWVIKRVVERKWG